MNRTSRRTIRLAVPLTGLLLATIVGVTPVLAAAGTGGRTATASTAQADAPGGRIHCTREWLAAKAEPTVEHWKAVGLCEIDRRLVTIERLGNHVNNARALTDEHEVALEAILHDSAAGLRALRAEIEADTTLVELREDITSIFEDFRIYALVVRQVWLVGAADTVDVAGAKLEGTAERLAALIAQAEANGKDVTEALEHLAAMEAAIAEALEGVDGVADAVLPLTPADWNAGTAGPILREARQAIADARADLHTAMAEARQVLAALAG